MKEVRWKSPVGPIIVEIEAGFKGKGVYKNDGSVTPLRLLRKGWRKKEAMV
jgi:hypothetical protein